VQRTNAAKVLGVSPDDEAAVRKKTAPYMTAQKTAPYD
jgi:hypothetical protein